jgi:hypothetical protein
MNTDILRRPLAALSDEHLAAGGDPYLLASELSEARLRVLADTRCDRAGLDDADGEIRLIDDRDGEGGDQ